MLTVRRTVLMLFAAAVSAFAGEYAVLSTGFRLHVQTHVIEDGNVTLQTDNGLITLPSSMVQSFEVEEYTPPPPPTAPAAVPAIGNSPLPERRDPAKLLTDAALHAGVPAALVHSVARAESGMHANAVSPKGAIGLMQLMPATAASLNANPYDPEQNAEAGARYLADLLFKYKDDEHQVTKALAAYNAGPGAVDKYHGIPPYRETINYVNRVVRQYLKTQDSQ